MDRPNQQNFKSNTNFTLYSNTNKHNYPFDKPHSQQVQHYQKYTNNQYENQRIFKIGRQLTKLDKLIQSTQRQSIEAANILKHCTNYSDDQGSNASAQYDILQQTQSIQQPYLNQKQKQVARRLQLNKKFEINLNDLQQHDSFQEDTIHIKRLKQDKFQAKIQYQKASNKGHNVNSRQIEQQNLMMSQSQCLNSNNQITQNNISQNYSNDFKFIQNGRILSHSHHFQEQSEQFHDMSSANQISQIKAVDTTIKKTKQQKNKNDQSKLRQKLKNNSSQVKANQSSNKKNKKMLGQAIGVPLQKLQKQRILSNKQKQKIGRIKSQNKFMNNQSNFGRGIKIIKQKMKIQIQQNQRDAFQRNLNIKTKQNSELKDKEKSKLKIKKFMFASTSKSNTYQKNCNFNSIKGQPLNSKRNIKYNSISKPSTASNLQMLAFHQPNNQKFIQKSKNQNSSKFHLNLQKQVTMKISDLKLKKNLCQIQTNYLSASVKITKQQIDRTFQMRQYSDERLLKHFIIKSLVKFISQYNDQNWQDEKVDLESSTQNQVIVQKTIKSPQKFIKVINKLPDILRRRNVVSEKRCKQFISEKLFTDQKITQLSNNGLKNSQHTMHKDILYQYMSQLHTYLQFLLNNSMIHQTKRSHIFNPSADTDGFFSDRSANNLKKKQKNRFKDNNDSCNKIQGIQGESQCQQIKKQYDSQRKKQEGGLLKRVNTAKNLKKTGKTKLKK